VLTKANLERLAQMRLDDAIVLLRANKASSAYYLAGYAIELALKVCISKLFQPDTIPDKAFVDAIYTHKLSTLLNVAGLAQQFDADSKADPELATNWVMACKWNETSRYEFHDPLSAAALIGTIAEPQHGVFQWLKKHW
jgi:HEPN domain-containing protein